MVVVKRRDSWHPILWRNITIEHVAKVALPELQRLSEEAGRASPLFCPRIRLEITNEPVDGEREPGRGSIDQILSDLDALKSLGAEHVTLDWFTADLEKTRDHSHGWQMLATLADELPGSD